MSSTHHQDIIVMLDAVRWRMCLRRASDAFFVALTCAASLALLAGLVHRLHGALGGSLAIAIAIAVISIPLLIAVLLAAIWPRPSRERAALTIDRALAGRDLITAALDQLERPAAQRAGAAGVVLAQASKFMRSVHPADVVNWRCAWSGARPLLALAPALAAAVLFTGPAAERGGSVSTAKADITSPTTPAGAVTAVHEGAVAQVQKLLAATHASLNEPPFAMPVRATALPQDQARALHAAPRTQLPELIAKQTQSSTSSATPLSASDRANIADQPGGTDAGHARAATASTDTALADTALATLAIRHELSVQRGDGNAAAGSSPDSDLASSEHTNNAQDLTQLSVAAASAHSRAPLATLSPALRAYADRYLTILERAQ